MSPELEQFIEEEVSSGRFANREAFLEYAVHLVKDEYDDTVSGIQAGLDDVEAGRVKPVDEAFAAIRRAIESSSH